MCYIYKALILAFITKWASVRASDIPKESMGATAPKSHLRVISFHPEHTQYKATYQETSAWARLENEVLLPKSFTICSAATWQEGYWGHVFFTVLGQNGQHFLSAMVLSKQMKSQPYLILKDQGIAPTDVTIPMMISSKWVHSCMALSFNSDHVEMQWVMNGISVKNTTVETDGHEPKNLTSRLFELLKVYQICNIFFKTTSENFSLVV